MYMESFGGIHAQTKEQYFTFDFCFVAQSDSFFSRSLSLLLYCCFFFYSTGTYIGCICVALAFKYRLLNGNFSWSCVHYIMLRSIALDLKSGWPNLQNLINRTRATQLGSTFLWCCFMMECARAVQGGVGKDGGAFDECVDDFLVWQFKWKLLINSRSLISHYLWFKS